MEVIERKKLRNKGGKIQANARRKEALKRLEKQYEAFKASGVAKEAWITNGGKRIHEGRSFEAECQRLSNEIANLKKNII